MHKIIWDMGIVGMLTDNIASDDHIHWALQLFLHPDENMDLSVEEKLQTGHCILVNANKLHSFYTHDNIYFTMLILPGSKLAEHLQHTYLADRASFDFTEMLTEDITEAFRDFVKRGDKESYLLLQKKLSILWKMDDCPYCHGEERTEKVIELLEKENLSIDELSDKMALSPSRLAHIFKDSTGVPLKSYLVFNKIYKAYQDLFAGKNITDAAMDAGFDSPSHFASTTKSMIGTNATHSIKDSEFLKV